MTASVVDSLVTGSSVVTAPDKEGSVVTEIIAITIRHNSIFVIFTHKIGFCALHLLDL